MLHWIGNEAQINYDSNREVYYALNSQPGS